jgi:hypothetical protein
MSKFAGLATGEWLAHGVTYLIVESNQREATLVLASGSSMGSTTGAGSTPVSPGVVDGAVSVAISGSSGVALSLVVEDGVVIVIPR